MYVLECSCNTWGTTENICRQDDGICDCRENVVGERCDKCHSKYYPFPSCDKGKYDYALHVLLIYFNNIISIFN